MDSKSIVRFVRPWVQIPPAAPQKACNQVDFRLFSFSQVFNKLYKNHRSFTSAGFLPASLLYLTNDFIPAILYQVRIYKIKYYMETQPMPAKKHIELIDILKGIAILSVLLCHSIIVYPINLEAIPCFLSFPVFYALIMKSTTDNTFFLEQSAFWFPMLFSVQLPLCAKSPVVVLLIDKST